MEASICLDLQRWEDIWSVHSLSIWLGLEFFLLQILLILANFVLILKFSHQ